MAVVHNAELIDIIVDGGESAKSLNRRGMARLLALVDAGEVQAVIIAKLDRLTRSVKDLCTLLERFERRGVALVSVAESPRHRLRSRAPSAEHHDGCKPVGTRGDRRTHPGRHEP
jgi:site-specific DNA recombinase